IAALVSIARGTDLNDFERYVLSSTLTVTATGLAAGDVLVDRYVLARCDCGSLDFRLDASELSYVFRRICAACSVWKWFWEDNIEEAKQLWESEQHTCWRCSCGADVINIAGAFVRPGKRLPNLPECVAGSAQAIAIRCVTCGFMSFLEASTNMGCEPDL